MPKPEHIRPPSESSGATGAIIVAGVVMGATYLLVKGGLHALAQIGMSPDNSSTDTSQANTSSQEPVQVVLLPGVSNPHVTGHFNHYGHDGIPLHGVISKEMESDAWGPYYNQRDERWGGLLLNGQQGFPIWKEGCYASAMAMVEAHFGVTVNGHVVTPADIDANTYNFVPSTAEMYAYLDIPGHPEIHETIFDNPTKADFMRAVDEGHVAILGLHHDPQQGMPQGWDHFVVVTGYEKLPNGDVDLIVRDPDDPDGKDVPLGEYFQIANGWHIIGGKDYHI